MTRSAIEPDSDETAQLLKQVEAGKAVALDRLLDRHRDEMKSFVEFHMNPRLGARFDPSDVVQEAQWEMTRRIAEFLAKRPMPFRLWARRKAYERLLNLERDHLKRARRSLRREAPWPDHSSLLLVRPLLATGPSPDSVAQAKERNERISRAVARLAESDRQILLLRHGDDLPFEEISCLLDITAAAARKRFGRALIRLQHLLIEEGLLSRH